MAEKPDPKVFSGPRLFDRQIDELVGLARGLIADNILNDDEILCLFNWLSANQDASDSPLTAPLARRVEEALADGVIDDEERAGLFEYLSQLVANDSEAGEAVKSSTLPLCDPPPDVVFEGQRFCFTGSFTYGKRKDCEAAVVERGGFCKSSVAWATRFVVIGEYATDAWMHSTFGRKIEHAMGYREQGAPISIIGEAHWRKFL